MGLYRGQRKRLFSGQSHTLPTALRIRRPSWVVCYGMVQHGGFASLRRRG